MHPNIKDFNFNLNFGYFDYFSFNLYAADCLARSI